MPPLKARASLRYGNRLLFAEVNGLASDAQTRIDQLLQEQPTAGYALLGFKAGVHHSNVNVSIGVDNTLDRLCRKTSATGKTPAPASGLPCRHGTPGGPLPNYFLREMTRTLAVWE
ncbi:MAG: hypothetical protein LAQ30_22270, partial [Acidobacteriia bacterium]|nr:hypothetical protein [Terriglobia bacterium]